MLAKILRGVLVSVLALGLTAGSAAFAQTVNQLQTPRKVIKSATLDVQMTPEQLKAGQRTLVTLTIVNTGNVPVQGVSVRYNMPVGFKFVETKGGSPDLINKTPTVTPNGSGLVWGFKTMAPGKQSSVYFFIAPNEGVKGTRCGAAILDPVGIHGVRDSACVSVEAKAKPAPKPSPKPLPKPLPKPAPKPQPVPKPVPSPIVIVPPVVVPSPVLNQDQNQKQGQNQSQWQTQNNDQTTNVDVKSENKNENNITINLN